MTHKIIAGDTLQELRKLRDGSIDFICADFPYNISGKGGMTMKGGNVIEADFGEWDKFESDAVYLDWVFQVCEQYKRILKPNASAVLYFGYKHMGWIGYELQRRGWFSFRQPLILEKENPQLNVKQSGFRSQMETAIWIVNDRGAFARPRTFNFLGQDRMLSIIPYKIGHEGRKGKKHPTEKPLEPIARYIEIFSNPGDRVLDNFAGSGTTGIAAQFRGRNAISIEKEDGFIEIIRTRQKAVERKLATTKRFSHIDSMGPGKS